MLVMLMCLGYHVFTGSRGRPWHPSWQSWSTSQGQTRIAMNSSFFRSREFRWIFFWEQRIFCEGHWSSSRQSLSRLHNCWILIYNMIDHKLYILGIDTHLQTASRRHSLVSWLDWWILRWRTPPSLAFTQMSSANDSRRSCHWYFGVYKMGPYQLYME